MEDFPTTFDVQKVNPVPSFAGGGPSEGSARQGGWFGSDH